MEMACLRSRPTIEDEEGLLLLSYARIGSQTELAPVLRATTVRNKNGNTGRELAERKGNTAVLERLDAIKKRTDANRKKRER